MKATLKTIYDAAHKAADELFNVTSELELQSSKLEAFKASGLSPLDYVAFEAHFNERRLTLKNLANQPAPSAIAEAATQAA